MTPAPLPTMLFALLLLVLIVLLAMMGVEMALIASLLRTCHA